MPPTIVHFETDTLPHVVTGPAGAPAVDLLLPFRVDVGHTGVTVRSWAFTVQVDGRPWSARVESRRLPAGLADELRGRMDRTGAFSFTHLPAYAALDDAGIAANRVVYVEGRLPRVPEGAEVTYALAVTTGRDGEEPIVAQSATYRTHAVDPRFAGPDVKRTVMPADGGAQDAYVVMHRRAAGLDRIRVDVLDLGFDGPPERAALAVDVGGATVVDLGAAPREGVAVDVPLVDIAADSVTFAVAHDRDAPPPTVTVTYRGRTGDPIDLAEEVDVGCARVVFVNFAIQGLNDLFATPDDDYDPPRTYTQLTMRDETANYSSRPGVPENGDGDGYAFTIEAHRRFGVPQMWAMNGGLLGLLAHDCPADLAKMAADVEAGVMVPVVAGYGAHRLPYYSTETNLDAIEFGAQALQNVVGYTRPVRRVYYPDSRITVNRPNVTDALKKGGVEFLVVDGGTHEDGTQEANILVQNVTPAMGRADPDHGGRFLDWRYLWHDTASDTHVLFIDAEMKDSLLGSTPEEADRGTIALNLRRKLLDFAGRPAERAGNLVVYSDDADKASGNGWFDGSTGNNQRYQAALSWVAAHPWVRAVTTEDLGPADSVGDLELEWATDPYIQDKWDLGGPTPLGLAFDTWFAAWAGTRAAWLNETLYAITNRAEKAIRCRVDGGRGDDQLVVLARLYFLMCLHESQWSKRPRIDPPNEGFDAVENFVAAETVALRNAHVFLAASVWAQWATAQPEEPTRAYRDGGPVVDDVATFENQVFAASGGRPAWSRDGLTGLQWDHDPLANVVLYNQHALVVVDRNGGRITHLFVMVDGRPVSVSGTHKAYQSLALDWASDAGSECDGLVLQNTVCTPNHAYVACDVDASSTTVGASPAAGEVYGWAYPDNFNAYEVAGGPSGADAAAEVALTYGPGSSDASTPATIADLEKALAEDRAAKFVGDPGIVLHDTATYGAFRKTIRLVDREVRVSYEGTRPGHRVANEFCVDLLAAALHGQKQTHEVVGDTATVTNDAGLAVQVRLRSGCDFSAATRLPVSPPSVESLRLHRVMTDNLELVAPDGGDFGYTIVLPGSPSA